MTPIRILIPGPPVAKGRPRFGRGRTFTPAKTRRAERDIGWLAREAMAGRKMLDGPVNVLIEVGVAIPASLSARRTAAVMAGVELPIGRPDIDNLAKLLLDAINSIVWRDDAQVTDLRITKRYSLHPATHVTIIPVLTALHF